MLKFDGYSQGLYDVLSNKIQDMSIKAPVGMTVFVDPTNKTVCIVDKSKIRLNI